MRPLILSVIPVFLLLLSPSGSSAQEQDVFVPISKYIQAGDSEKLSAWFAGTLEMDILGVVNVCSKAQAKQIIKDFFANNSPKSFSITYRSGKPPMRYGIGSLSAGGNKFRVTIFVKTKEEGNYIEQMRIERE